MGMNDFFDVQLGGLDGAKLDLDALSGRAVLVVNVASRCGLTPQYAALERLQRRYGDERFSVLGVPCNQFANQEPETEDEIRTFCSATYGTTFPITEKVEVNGPNRHRLYRKLADTPDSDGRAGDVDWNFEKFLVSGAGEVRARFRPGIDPESEEVVHAIESVLADPSTRLAEGWETAPASAIRTGDRVRPRDGIELTVTRIQTPFFGREEMLALIEATEDRWLKVPMTADSPVQVRRRLS
jgi:glutathione peroxidase